MKQPKNILVELTERELEILQTAMRNLDDSIQVESTSLSYDTEIHDLASRIDNIYCDFDQIPESKVKW